MNGALPGQCVQLRESVAPVLFEYVFAGHREHVGLPMSSWNLPGVHKEQTWFEDALLDKYDPAVHVLFIQYSLPVSSWYWPCGQGSHVTFPIAAANLPAEQAVQVKSVSPFECFPF